MVLLISEYSSLHGRKTTSSSVGTFVAGDYLAHDDTKQCATSLGLQVQSVVARVNFPHEGTSWLHNPASIP
jgi:hypothetical protein